MKKLIIICIFLILLTSYVSAFAITSFYYEGYPLILNPGETKNIQLLLQNEKTSNPVTIEAKLAGESDIAELTGKTIFSLKSGEIDVPVNVRISIPETAKIGDEYAVGMTFTTTTKAKTEMLGIGTKITKSFPIVIGKVLEPKKSLLDIIPLKGIAGIVVILALVVLAFMFYKKKKK